MMNQRKKKISVICALALVLGILCGFVAVDRTGAPVVGLTADALGADEAGTTAEIIKDLSAKVLAVAASDLSNNIKLRDPEPEDDVEEELIAVLNGRIVESNYTPVYVNGILVLSGTVYNGTTYVSVVDFCKEVYPDAQVGWDEDSGEAVIECEGLSVRIGMDSTTIIANGRALYLPHGMVVSGNEALLPVRELAKLFGSEVVWHAETRTVDVVADDPCPLKSADEFYNEDDLYWLSHLIDAEAGNQEMDGMIAVGNVVLNRVSNPTCPNTVHDVVFDTKYGVQFSVILDGSIYGEPCEDAVLAAKYCLEGYNTAGNSLYFVNPGIGATSWFRSTRTFVTSIGDHDFYA